MKKPAVVLLITLLCGIGLAGCSSQDTAAPKQETATAKTEPVKTTDETTTSAPTSNTTQPDNDPSIAEVRQVFNLDSSMRQIASISITGIATGDMELGLQKEERLALAKAISRSLGEIGWKQEDFPPGIFVSSDAKKFSVGFKHKNGDFSLKTYEAQADGSFKDVKDETKKAGQ
ncbi:MAG: hypothetical protein WCC10_03260 [Tumebacillaceae bacterium]